MIGDQLLQTIMVKRMNFTYRDKVELQADLLQQFLDDLYTEIMHMMQITILKLFPKVIQEFPRAEVYMTKMVMVTIWMKFRPITMHLFVIMMQYQLQSARIQIWTLSFHMEDHLRGAKGLTWIMA